MAGRRRASEPTQIRDPNDSFVGGRGLSCGQPFGEGS